MSEAKVTVVTEVSKRSEIVALADWRTNTGEAVNVLCTEADPEECARLLKVLPGERPQLGIPEGADQQTIESHTRRILELAPDMIELGTSLAAADGSDVRPAFYFGGARDPHALSLDGAKLSETDLMRLAVSVLRCSGYLGGAAEAMFLRRGRGGPGPGRGALEVLPVGGADAAAGAS
jgi:hypothetical protein